MIGLNRTTCALNIAVLSLLLSLTVYGTEMLPLNTVIFSAEGNSHLSISCSGNKSQSKITCSFSEVSISKISEEDKKSANEKFKSALESEISSKGIEKVRNAFCKDMSVNKIEQLRNKFKEANIPDYRLKPVETGSSIVSELCKCRTSECLIDNFQKLEDIKNNSCTVWINQFSGDFKRENADSWISQDDSPLCVTSISRLQRDKKHKLFWSFSVQRVSKESDSELCKDVDTHRYRKFSHEYPSTAELNCKFIDTKSP